MLFVKKVVLVWCRDPISALVQFVEWLEEAVNHSGRPLLLVLDNVSSMTTDDDRMLRWMPRTFPKVSDALLSHG